MRDILKMITGSMTALLLTFAIAARSADNVEGAAQCLVGATWSGILFGLLNVTSICGESKKDK